MALNLCNHEHKARDAIQAFWQTREDARQKQVTAGKSDQGERAGVTGGKNMDGFSSLVTELVRTNGLPDAQVHHQRAVLTLPGYFRPTKLWDLSFGNNFNNRTEEAIGTSHDLWTAYREGAFGQQELYSSAAVLATPRSAIADGRYAELSAMTGLRSFVASLAGHIATSAAL